MSHSMISKDDFPKLSYLLKAYFFQGWEDLSEDPMSDVLRDEPAENLRAVRDDIDRFLGRKFSREACDAFVEELFLGAIDDDFGAFLMEVRQRLDGRD